MTWNPESNVPVCFKGGFGGFVVRHFSTGQLGYFKIRNYKFDVLAYHFGKLVGIPIPEIEFAQVTRVEPDKQGVVGPLTRHGAVSHFWGTESLDVMAYQKLHGAVPPGLSSMSGLMAFAWWLGYGDMRNEHILWEPNRGFAFIDFDDIFSWRYTQLRHLIGPQIMLQHFDGTKLKETADRIRALTYDEIFATFKIIEPTFYKFRKDEEARFSKRLYEVAQAMPETIGRYWERGIVDRNAYPEVSAQDRDLWIKRISGVTWRQQVETCQHAYHQNSKGLWQCNTCKFIWPLLDLPD
jgi:hypothetical protein